MKLKALTLLPLLAGGFLGSQPTLGQEMSLAEIAQVYRQAQGGGMVLDGLDSIRINGVRRIGGQSKAFTLLRKRPDLYRLNMYSEADNGVVHFAYDGEQAWRWDHTGYEAQRVNLSSEPLIAQDIEFFNPLLSLGQNRSKLDYLGNVSVPSDRGGLRKAMHLRYRNRFGDAEDIFLDPNTYLVFRLVYRPNTEANPIVSYFSDYRQVAKGYMVPYEVLHKVMREDAEVTIGYTRVENVEINPGLLSLYFRPPKVNSPES